MVIYGMILKRPVFWVIDRQWRNMISVNGMAPPHNGRSDPKSSGTDVRPSVSRHQMKPIRRQSPLDLTDLIAYPGIEAWAEQGKTDCTEEGTP